MDNLNITLLKTSNGQQFIVSKQILDLTKIYGENSLHYVIQGVESKIIFVKDQKAHIMAKAGY